MTKENKKCCDLCKDWEFHDGPSCPCHKEPECKKCGGKVEIVDGERYHVCPKDQEKVIGNTFGAVNSEPVMSPILPLSRSNV